MKICGHVLKQVKLVLSLLDTKVLFDYSDLTLQVFLTNRLASTRMEK